MGSGKLAYVALMWIVVVVGTAPIAEAILCPQITSMFSPCLNYLKGVGPLPAGCCNSFRSIVSAGGTTVDRQTVCNCLKSIAASTSGVKPKLFTGLPGACKVKIPFDINPSARCV
ncbi:Non-specific lipid-transfer protein [Quillaja saponaria]|uniref:Non-specific lipid-transfer protein n=1 Tax=Quillaja saponaria TaxID=32244 RepID=A0AAD7L218_QUISA|nr:Non-specific lipid-transfer protein [Quillaja saponaria]